MAVCLFVCFLFLSFGIFFCLFLLLLCASLLGDVTFQLENGTNDYLTYICPSNVPIESIASGRLCEYKLAWIVGSLRLAFQPHLPTTFLVQEPIAYYLVGIIFNLHRTGLGIWAVPTLISFFFEWIKVEEASPYS